MPATPFAAIEQRVSRAVMRHHANATAVIAGVSVPVIFDLRASAPFGEQVDSAECECTGASADLAALERGAVIVVDAVAYTVERLEPDGPGMTRLILARSA